MTGLKRTNKGHIRCLDGKDFVNQGMAKVLNSCYVKQLHQWLTSREYNPSFVPAECLEKVHLTHSFVLIKLKSYSPEESPICDISHS